MAGDNELVSVFRSADMDAEDQATIVREELAKANIRAEVYDDSAPGVPEGAFEVRVPAAQQQDAEQFLAAHRNLANGTVDLSHDLDMVTVFRSESGEAEMLATQVRSILEAQEIPSVLVSGSMFPNLPFEVRVPRQRLEEARQAIAAAEEAGPGAAEEAELESEAGSASGSET